MLFKRQIDDERVAKGCGFKSAAEMDKWSDDNLALMRERGVGALFPVYHVNSMQGAFEVFNHIIAQAAAKKKEEEVAAAKKKEEAAAAKKEAEAAAAAKKEEEAAAKKAAEEKKRKEEEAAAAAKKDATP